jgi:segregation and condensation protein A
LANGERLEGDGTSPASPERGRNDADTSAAMPQRGRNDADAAWSVKLPHFEGPLDLLLHLCQKHELDILEIPIAFVTEKYLEYLAVMQLMQLDLAAEYLVMAATLAHIKSKMLLPAPPPGQEDEGLPEDEIDPRDALIRRLLEYQKYKHAGEQLAARGIEGRDVFLRGTPIDEAAAEGLAPLAEIPLFSLVEAFQRVLDRSRVRLSHDVVADRISLSERIIELADLIGLRKRATFEDLFDGLGTNFELVITFLALLEMTRLKMTRLFQAEPLGPLYVELATAGSDGTSPAMPERGRNDERTSPAMPERGRNDGKEGAS